MILEVFTKLNNSMIHCFWLMVLHTGARLEEPKNALLRSTAATDQMYTVVLRHETPNCNLIPFLSP